MASCGYCGNTILFGGKRRGAARYCKDKCLQNGEARNMAGTIPADIVQQHTHAIHQGSCPQCDGPGPVDVHISYRVWSAVYLTSWSSHPRVSCRRCGTKCKARDAAFSLVLGWWGIPFGLIYTPIQIIRNVTGMVRKLPVDQPSPALEDTVRIMLASRLVQAEPAN